jgi:hypothetical protein
MSVAKKMIADCNNKRMRTPLGGIAAIRVSGKFAQ